MLKFLKRNTKYVILLFVYLSCSILSNKFLLPPTNFSLFSKVAAYTCITPTREPNNDWGRHLNLGNFNFLNFENEKPEVPNGSYRESPDCFEYVLYGGMRTKSNGEKVPAVEELEIFFDKKNIQSLIIQAHDFNDTVRLDLDLKLNGQKIETKVVAYDLRTTDGCGVSKYDPDRKWRNGCYKTYRIDINKELTSIRFKPGAEDGEAAAIRLIKIDHPLPPICEGLIKTPDKQNYLPSEIITLTAKASDLGGRNLTYNNWWISPTRNGAFISSTSVNTVSFRTNPVPNITEDITFNVSNGYTSSTCTYPISTKLLYKCDADTISCLPSSTEGVSDITSCDSNCKKTYTCDPNLGCVAVLNNGQFPSQSSCEASCNYKYVSCESIKFNKVSNNKYTIDANLKSFSYGKVASIKWMDSTNNSLIFSENINLPASYFEFNKSISYNLLNSGNTNIELLVDDKLVCQTNINSNYSANINLSFVNELGNVVSDNLVSLNEEKTTNLKIDYEIIGGSIDSYFLTLSCPNLLCKFDNNLNTKTVTNLQNVGSLVLPVKFSGNIEGKFAILASGVDAIGQNFKQASTNVEIVSSPKLSLLVYKSSRVLQVGENVSEFCTDTSTLLSLPENATFDLKNNDTGEITTLQYPGTNFPKNIYYSNYIFSKNLINNLQDYEIKCIKYTITYADGSKSDFSSTFGNSVAFNLNSLNSNYAKNVNFLVILGFATNESWFNGIGGSAYAYSSIKNSVPQESNTYFLSNNNLPKISAGLSVQNEFIGANSLNLSELGYINYNSSNTKPGFNFLENLQVNFESVKAKGNYISNISEISFSSEPKVYVIDNDVDLNKNTIEILNTKHSGTKSPQILLVNGAINVKITDNSQKASTVPLVLISLKNSSNSVFIGYDNSLTFPNSSFIGGIFSRSNINFASTQKFISNNLPTEKIYLAPQIFLGQDSSLDLLKEVKVIVSLID